MDRGDRQPGAMVLENLEASDRVLEEKGEEGRVRVGKNADGKVMVRRRGIEVRSDSHPLQATHPL